MITQGFLQVYAAGDSSAEAGYHSYEWTRIDSEKELRDYVEKGKTDQDAGRKFIDNTRSQSTNDNDINNWFKVIIGFNHGSGKEFFISGSNMVSDGEEISCARVLPTYFYDEKGNQQHIGDKTLNSTSGLYAPYIKYAGEENGDPRAYVRFATAGTLDGKPSEVLSSEMIIASLSWYGIAHHACAYAEFAKTSAASPDGDTHGAACSHSNYNEFILKWNSNSTLQLYICPSGSADRYWTSGMNSNTIEMTQKCNENENQYYLYFGVPSTNRLIDTSLLVESMTTTYNSTIITENALMEIPKGSCVVMEGLCKVNGAILVNGGVLIIKGTLDTSTSFASENAQAKDAYGSSGLSLGSIKVTNGGSLLVLDTGVLCMRHGSASLIIEKGSHVEINGGAAVSGKIELSDSVLMVMPGSALIHGAKIPEFTSALSLGKVGIAANRNCTLDAFVSDEITDESTQGILAVSGKSYFYNQGLYYINPKNIDKCTFSNEASIYVDARTNYHATINNMMKWW